MSDSPQSTDWTALAVQAMDQQNEVEATHVAEEIGDASPRLTPSMLLAAGAKLLFLVAVGYFLVNRYGVAHLIWLALVGWYLVWPTITPMQQKVFK